MKKPKAKLQKTKHEKKLDLLGIDYSKEIKRRRQELKLTQTEVALLADMEIRQYWKLENTKVDLRMATLLGVAKALQKSEEKLLDTIIELFFKPFKDEQEAVK